MAPKALRDNVSRVKKPSPVGKGMFVCLRMADVLWQYNLLYRGWGTRLIEKLGGHPVHSSQLLYPAAISGLQPYYVLVNFLALGSSLKQVVHIVFVSEQAMDVGSGIAVACFNTVFNTVNTLLSLWTLTSSAASIPKSNSLLDTLSVPLITVGVGAYSLGLLVEATSEFQRKTFKQDPKNQGKPYGGGLFSLATNINYGAYTIWRTGYALTCGGLAFGAMTFAFFFHDFASRGVPVLNQYMSERYGDAYREIKNRVRYSLIPGIY
ncbi:membrane protein [Penicillium brasilianum]|uniref:Membrane protein n=1 Tax=Penicillium brasilianum TaxID=104259 RepID=A0A1S9R981_PENBI|nr:membrane protein [Penicillium brasilianum]